MNQNTESLLEIPLRDATLVSRPTLSIWMISLARTGVRSTAGHQSFKQQNWPVRVFDGVDAGNLPYPHPDEVPLLTKELISRRLSGGEIGCFMSHKKLLQAFLQTTDAWAFVVEDDAYLTTSSDIIHAQINELPTDPVIFFPFYDIVTRRPQPLTGEIRHGVQEYPELGPQTTAAYIVNRGAALSLLSNVFSWPVLPVDEALRRSPVRKFRALANHVQIDASARSIIDPGRNVARRSGSSPL
jgi:GR25 family glycosyltransferase involved in LPS biosynthesis